jgi:DNA-binding transcriptional regulator of glucitol operon
MQPSTQQTRNKQANIAVLIFVYYVHLLDVWIQLDHHQEVFMKCTIVTELYF